MTIIPFPGPGPTSAPVRLVVSNDTPPIAYAEGLLRSAIENIAEASRHALDAALGNGQAEQCFDLATISLEAALLDFLRLNGCSNCDLPLERLLRERKFERDQ